VALYGGIEIVNRPDPGNIQKLDLLPVPMVREMMRYGMRIDPDHFRDLSFRLSTRMTELKREITSQIPPDALERLCGVEDETEAYDEDGYRIDDGNFNIESPEQLTDLLYDVLGLHLRDVKIKRTKQGQLTTGKKTLEQLKREHPVIPLILEYRENSKLKGTYADSMPRKAVLHPRGPDCPRCGWDHREAEWRVHTEILTTRTATGRTAHKNPNLANIPARSKLGREIRSGFVASEGCVIVDRDFSGIELRLLASQSEDLVMMEVFRTGGDIHNTTACSAFGLKPEELDPLTHRIPSKTCNFSVVYGTTEMGLYEQLCASFGSMGMKIPEWLSEEWCAWFIAKWFETYAGAKRYLDRLEALVRRYGIAWTPCGRVRRVPEVRSVHSWIQQAGVRQGQNMPIQGGNAELMKLTMGEATERFRILRQYGIKVRPINTIYDSWMGEVDEDDGETVSEVMAEVMAGCMTDKQTGEEMCLVPIKSDGKCVRKWEK
jgi:DNA polymerase-1